MLGIGGYDVSRRIGNVGDKRDEVSDAQQRLQGAERGKAVVRNLTGGALGSCRPSSPVGPVGPVTPAAPVAPVEPVAPWARSPQSYPSGRLRQALRSGRWDRYSPPDGQGQQQGRQMPSVSRESCILFMCLPAFLKDLYGSICGLSGLSSPFLPPQPFTMEAAARFQPHVYYISQPCLLRFNASSGRRGIESRGELCRGLDAGDVGRGEQPLDRLADGYSNTAIFRTIGFIGDSLLFWGVRVEGQGWQGRISRLLRVFVGTVYRTPARATGL